MKLGIILLNYKNYVDTIECIKTILKQNFSDFEIIVVDNASQNNSILKIQNEFCNIDKKIHYIQNDVNYGFAKGNNVGICYAKNELKCDFVFVLNTDTLLFDSTTLSRLLSYYVKSCNVGVINPMCCDSDYKLMFPSFMCRKSLKIYSLRCILYYLKYFIKCMLGVCSKKFSYINTDEELYRLDDYKYVIQGCSYVLTPDFFQFYQSLFSETFLYCEEFALAIMLDKKKLKTINAYDVILIHKEGGSSIKINKQNGFLKLKHMIRSYSKVIKLFFMR